MSIPARGSAHLGHVCSHCGMFCGVYGMDILDSVPENNHSTLPVWQYVATVGVIHLCPCLC